MNLEQRKWEITVQIQKLPIGGRTIRINNIEKQLYDQLDEINDQINLFSADEVFIQDD